MGIFTKTVSTEVAHQLRQQMTPYHYERGAPLVAFNASPLAMAVGQVMAHTGINEAFSLRIEPTPTGGIAMEFQRRSLQTEADTVASKVVEELMKRRG